MYIFTYVRIHIYMYEYTYGFVCKYILGTNLDHSSCMYFG